MANIFENKNVIYCYTNKINNKKYIGQTSKKLIDRHKQHLKESKNKNRKSYNIPFHKAIRKYGIKNFKLEILHFAQSKEELNYFEIFYIKYYNSYAKYELGYNVASGGHNGNPFAGKTEQEMNEIFNDEWRKKISEIMKERLRNKENHPMYGKHHSESTKEKMSQNHKGFEGKHHSEESKKKIGESKIGDKNHNYNKHGKDHHCSKKVCQYDKEMNLIKIWDSIKDASVKLKIDSSAITKCCKGKKYKSVGGFIWKYYEEDDING